MGITKKDPSKLDKDVKLDDHKNLDEKLEAKVDVLFKLAESSWKEYDKRRVYEWQINFSLWGGLGIFSGFALRQNTPISLPSYTWVGFLVLAVVYIYFKYGMFKSNNWDQKKRHAYLNMIMDLYEISLEEKLKKAPGTSSRLFLLNWSHLSQIVITLLFLILTCRLLTT